MTAAATDSLAFHGVIPILATPFHDDETLDLESIDRLVRFDAAIGVDGLAILGPLGESSRLTDAERARVVDTAVKAAGTLPVIVGVNHAGTAATIALCQEAVELGASAVMLAPSAHPAPGERVTLEYFRRVAAKVAAPIVLQDHPPASQTPMPVESILRLLEEVPSIVCVRAGATPSSERIAALKCGMPEERATILTGLGALYGLFDLERGSDGFNTGFAFPEVLLAILHAFRDHGAEPARQLFTRYLPLIVFEQQPGVAVRKEILRQRGLISSNRVRHPGATIDAATAEQLRRLLDVAFPGEDLTAPVIVGAPRPFLVNI